MEIDWPKLFSLQQVLDERIMTEHGLVGHYFTERLLALHVEVGELANETRCFKYWSVKRPAEREAVLEEYVDGIHFILSLGLALQFEKNVPEMQQIDVSEINLVGQFLRVKHCIANLGVEKEQEVYVLLFSEYLKLGSMLGFTQSDIYSAYLEKNKLNHKRQDEGY